MSYNVTLLDARGQHRTVFLAPRIARRRSPGAPSPPTTSAWWSGRRSPTPRPAMDRERYIRARLDDPSRKRPRGSWGGSWSHRCTSGISTTGGARSTRRCTNLAAAAWHSTGVGPASSSQSAISRRRRSSCRSPPSLAKGSRHESRRHQPVHRADHQHPSRDDFQGAAGGHRHGPQGLPQVAHGPGGRQDRAARGRPPVCCASASRSTPC